jgi:protein O-mannosyl-transferase
VNLSAAVNYYFGRLNPAGYRLVDLLLHALSALLLFDIVRRTLRLEISCRSQLDGGLDRVAAPLALAVALLWAIHPLQTEAVCYVTQRTELMMGFFYLATLYCSLRFWQAAAGNSRISWLLLAVAAAAAGMASKEVMVSAPVIVLLYDRTFVSRSFKRALRDSWPLYVGLCLSWIVLVILNADAPRSRSAGFHGSVPAYSWWLTQARVVILYLRLVFWPWPLSIHHEIPYLHTAAEAWPYLVLVALLGGATLVALCRNSAVGFLGAWFFIILSPTSLVPITTEVAAERRMYLPLAAVVALVVIGGFSLVAAAWRRAVTGGRPSAVGWKFAALWSLAWLLPAVALGAVSCQQVTTLHDPRALWRRVLSIYPESDLAYVNLGFALMNSGDKSEAASCFARALKINPNSPDAHYNWGMILQETGQPRAAATHLASAVDLDPDNVLYRRAYGNLLESLGRYSEAVEQLQQSLEIDPHAAIVRNDLGMTLKEMGKTEEASRQLAEAVQLAPEVAEYHNNYGNVLRLLGKYPEAVSQLQRALDLKPDMREARFNLALTRAAQGHPEQSIGEYRRLLALYPDDAEAHAALGDVLYQSHQYDEAVAEYQRAVELDPDQIDARNNLGASLLEAGRTDEAIDQLEEAVRQSPDSAVSHFNLAEAYEAAGRREEAHAHARQALELARAAGQKEVSQQIEAWLSKVDSASSTESDASP